MAKSIICFDRTEKTDLFQSIGTTFSIPQGFDRTEKTDLFQSGLHSSFYPTGFDRTEKTDLFQSLCLELGSFAF